MQFTQVPNQYAPVGGALRYAVEAGTEKKTLAVSVSEAVWGATLGRKRFVGVTGARFDIGPYVRRVVKFEPRVGRTGVVSPDGRVVAVVVEVREQAGKARSAAGRSVVDGGSEFGAAGNEGRAESGTVGVEGRAGTVAAGKSAADGGSAAGVEGRAGTVAAPARTYLPALFAVEAPALLTEMPRRRLIGPEEADELTLLLAEPGEVVVTACRGAGQVVERYAMAEAGVQLFRLDMRDFPQAEAVTVDAGPCGAVEYVVVQPPEGARRVAWRSRAGSLEHYTFPEEQTTVVEAEKTRAYGPGGYVAAAREEWTMELGSAYESRKVLEALSGILSSPQVWLAAKNAYRPVDVLTERAEVYRNGVMSRMELVVRPVRKNVLPWN